MSVEGARSLERHLTNRAKRLLRHTIPRVDNFRQRRRRYNGGSFIDRLNYRRRLRGGEPLAPPRGGPVVFVLSEGPPTGWLGSIHFRFICCFLWRRCCSCSSLRYSSQGSDRSRRKWRLQNRLMRSMSWHRAFFQTRWTAFNWLRCTPSTLFVVNVPVFKGRRRRK